MQAGPSTYKTGLDLLSLRGSPARFGTLIGQWLGPQALALEIEGLPGTARRR